MKKGFKLLLSLATVFMVSGTVTACNVDKRTPEEKVQEAYDSLVYSGLNAVTSDIELITSVADLEDVAISYAVAADQNYLAVAEDGASIKVTRPTYNVGDVMLTPGFTATISYENVTKTKSFNVKIMKASTVITAAEYLQLTKDSGDVYSFSGEVVVEGTGAILVGDSTGLVYVYSNDAAEAVDVGDFVRIEGGFTAYNAVPQFAYNAKTPCTATKLNDSEVVDSYRFTKPESATAWGGADADAYVNKENPTVSDLQGKYINFEGVLSISGGKYYNVTIPGAETAVGSIAYPNQEMKDQLATLDGKMISATGYTLYISGSKYVNLFATEVKEVTVDDNKKAELALGSITVKDEVKEDFVLPATGTYDAEITWTSNNEALKIGEKTEAGYPVTVTRAATDVDVTLTAQAKVGTATQSKDFGVKVLADAPENVNYVVTPEADTEYRIGFEDAKTIKYFTGVMDGYYGASSENAQEGIVAKLVAVEGGYNVSFVDAKEKTQYINVVISGTHINFTFAETATSVYTYDTKAHTLVTEIDGAKYFFGSNGTYGTFGAYAYNRVEDEGIWPAHFYEVVNYEITPKTDVAFKLGFNDATTTKYFTGVMDGYYGASTTTASEAVDVKLVAVEGGYNVSFVDAKEKTQYINVVISGTHINFTFAETATSVYTWDYDHDTLVTEIDGAKYIFGSNGTYGTFGGYKFERVEEEGIWPAHFYTVSEVAEPEQPEEPEEPTPGAVKEVTIAGALEVGATLDADSQEVSADVYQVTGTVSRQPGSYGKVYLTDGENQIQVYKNKDPYTNLYEGYTATVKGNIQNYKGTIEIVNFEVVEYTAVNYSIEIPAFSNGTVTASATTDIAWGTEVEFTVTPAEGYAVDTVTVNDTEVNVVDNKFTYTVDRNLTVNATFKVEVAGEKTLTLFFSDAYGIDTGSHVDGSFTADGVTYGYVGLKSYSSQNYVMFGKNLSAMLYNSTAIPGYITKLEVTTTSGCSATAEYRINLFTEVQDEYITEGTTLVGKSATATLTADVADQYSYFNISLLNNGKNGQITKIVITYQEA